MSDPPAEQPAWLKTISENIEKMNSKLEGITESVEFATKTAQDAEKRAKNAEKKVGELHAENLLLKTELQKVQRQLSSLDSHSRRNNLIFEGIAESVDETWEMCEKTLLKIIKKVMKIDTEILFDRVHRIGRKATQGKPRPVIARFSFCKHKDLVWQNRFSLEGTKTYLRITQNR